MIRFEQIERHHKELRRGLTLMRADLFDLPHDALADQVLASVKYAGPDESDHTRYLRPQTPGDNAKFLRVGQIMMSQLESFGLVRASSAELEDGYVISYPGHASLADHDDGGMYDGGIVRLTLSTSGFGQFNSPVTALTETAPGDLLVQDLGRPVMHGVPKVFGPRTAAVWDFPGQVIR